MDNIGTVVLFTLRNLIVWCTESSWLKT